MANQSIRISLRAYDHILLDKSTDKIVKTAKSTGAIISGPVPLPTKRSIYTVLRSPHVDKKSREQFQTKIHKEPRNSLIYGWYKHPRYTFVNDEIEYLYD